MSTRNAEKLLFHRSQTVIPRAPYHRYALSRGLEQRFIIAVHGPYSGAFTFLAAPP